MNAAFAHVERTRQVRKSETFLRDAQEIEKPKGSLSATSKQNTCCSAYCAWKGRSPVRSCAGGASSRQRFGSNWQKVPVLLSKYSLINGRF